MANASASSPINPHFFQPLLPGFHSYLNIPVTFFSKYIKGTTNEDNEMVKLTSDASDKTWEVKLNGLRLTQGWQNFVKGHGGDLLFQVTCFGPSFCQILYDDDDVIQISSDSDSDKYQDTREASDNSCFVARVTSSNLSKDMLFLPINFSRSNGFMGRKCEIILLNEDGKRWKLFLTNDKTHGRVYIRTGWRRFCRENQKRVNDLLTFKLVQTGTKPVLQLCSSMYNRSCLRVQSSSSSSRSQDRFLTLTITPYCLKKSKLCIPGKFVWLNGIEKAKKIVVVDRYGFKRITSLKPDNKYGAMRMGKVWREFCEVNGVKAGDSFELELIKEEEETATYLLKFCTKV